MQLVPMKLKATRRGLITASLVIGGLMLAACGSAGPSVQARQAGETTTTTTTTTIVPETTTTTALAPTTTTTPPTTTPPVSAASGPPCTPEALTAAYSAEYGSAPASLKVGKCVAGWATSSHTQGFNPPTFALYRAEGEHWVALNRSGGKLCEGYGVPPEVAPQIGCDT